MGVVRPSHELLRRVKPAQMCGSGAVTVRSAVAWHTALLSRRRGDRLLMMSTVLIQSGFVGICGWSQGSGCGRWCRDWLEECRVLGFGAC
jgi:hypothetical protein